MAEADNFEIAKMWGTRLCLQGNTDLHDPTTGRRNIDDTDPRSAESVGLCERLSNDSP